MTAEINEFLKTCRLYYRMLVTVCVAALLFAIAPSDTQRFQQAIQEVELVSKMDIARLLDQAVREKPEAKIYIDKVATIMSAIGMTYKKTGISSPLSRTLLAPQGQRDYRRTSTVHSKRTIRGLPYSTDW